MLAALKKYGAGSKGIPSLGVWASYQAADVMIKGLEVADDLILPHDLVGTVFQDQPMILGQAGGIRFYRNGFSLLCGCAGGGCYASQPGALRLAPVLEAHKRRLRCREQRWEAKVDNSGLVKAYSFPYR
jgi:hypothetical protein